MAYVYPEYRNKKADRICALPLMSRPHNVRENLIDLSQKLNTALHHTTAVTIMMNGASFEESTQSPVQSQGSGLWAKRKCESQLHSCSGVMVETTGQLVGSVCQCMRCHSGTTASLMNSCSGVKISMALIKSSSVVISSCVRGQRESAWGCQRRKTR
jgi:aspartokinase